MIRMISLMLLMSMLISPSAFAESNREPLRLGGFIPETDYWTGKGIPTVRPSYGWDDYMTIMKGEQSPDLYCFSTNNNDFRAAKAAEVWADLSQSNAIQEWTNRLHPDIKELVTTEDGKIIGFAWFATFRPMYWRQDAWDEAGLSQGDVPQSYTELLDFLGKWVERIKEAPVKRLCVADVGNEYVPWLMDMLINAWEMQQYNSGETLDYNTPEFVALLERTKSIGQQLNEAEASQRKQKKMPLFENYSGGERYNAGRDYGLSHTIPFRISRDQPELMRGTAMIYVVCSDSPWLSEIIQYIEYDLTDGALSGGGKNADMLIDVQPRVKDSKEANASSTVTAGYLADLDDYTGTLCFAPMLTLDMYENARLKFIKGELSAEELAVQMSLPKRDPNK